MLLIGLAGPADKRNRDRAKKNEKDLASWKDRPADSASGGIADGGIFFFPLDKKKKLIFFPHFLRAGVLETYW